MSELEQFADLAEIGRRRHPAYWRGNRCTAVAAQMMLTDHRAIG